MKSPSLTFRALAAVAALAVCLGAAGAGEPAPPDRALLIVKLPADAKLVVGSSATLQSGGERRFVSPPLNPAKKYVYELTATWKEKGEDKELKLTAQVSAGKATVVDFFKGEQPPPPKPEEKEKDKKDEKKDPVKDGAVLAPTSLFTSDNAIPGRSRELRFDAATVPVCRPWW